MKNCLPIYKEMVVGLWTKKKKIFLTYKTIYPYKFPLNNEAVYNLTILRTENIFRYFTYVLIFEM